MILNVKNLFRPAVKSMAEFNCFLKFSVFLSCNFEIGQQVFILVQSFYLIWMIFGLSRSFLRFVWWYLELVFFYHMDFVPTVSYVHDAHAWVLYKKTNCIADDSAPQRKIRRKNNTQTTDLSFCPSKIKTGTMVL